MVFAYGNQKESAWRCGSGHCAVRLGMTPSRPRRPSTTGTAARRFAPNYYDIAQAAGKPVIIYNFPGNTGKSFDLADRNYIKLLQSGSILGIKHTNQVVYQLERIKHINYNAFRNNHMEEALELQIKANNIMNTLCDVGLIPAIKYVLTTVGIDAGVPRRPFRALDEEQKRYIDTVVQANLMQQLH